MRKAVLPLFASSILAIAATASLAADLPSRRAPPVYAPPPIPAFSWTGFYVGANVGAGFDPGGANTFALPNGSVANSGGTDGVLSLGKSNDVQFTGGAQIGYNYQFNPGSSVVAGVEADAQYLHFTGGTSNYTFTPTTAVPPSTGLAFVQIPGLTTFVQRDAQRADFFGTVRGRLGYTFDRLLAYGTGGFAYDTNRIGYAVGGGLEYALTNNISIRGEYLYVALGSGGGTIAPVFNAAANTVFLNLRGGRETFNVARMGVDYKFDLGAPLAPVVARY